MSAPPAAAVDVVARLGAVTDRIRRAGGDPARLTIVAVTKGQPEAVVRAAVAAGLHDLGENYAQAMPARVAATPGVRWHFLGPVQRNKVKRLAPHVHLWHAVDRVEAGEAIAGHAPGAQVLVQVNVSGEEQKHGCATAEVERVVAGLRALELDVAGLMAVGPSGPPEGSRRGFRALATAAAGLGLTELSMGMSRDLEIAVEEGATIVRIGTDLFGPRPEPRPVRR